MSTRILHCVFSLVLVGCGSSVGEISIENLTKDTLVVRIEICEERHKLELVSQASQTIEYLHACESAYLLEIPSLGFDESIGYINNGLNESDVITLLSDRVSFSPCWELHSEDIELFSEVPDGRKSNCTWKLKR